MPPKNEAVGEFGALVRVLDGRLADSNGDDIAHDHHQGHFGDQVKEAE